MSGRLTLVATPIGNLGDLSERAIATLRDADLILCEDTRRTRELLSARDVRAGRRLLALHDHNESEMCATVVARLSAGDNVALVSDAGTPTVSDPGARVVAAVVAAGLAVSTVPGPSAALAALAVSGLATDRFCVEGFVPRTVAERAARIASWRDERRTIVCFESPRRLARTLADLARALGDRRAVVARELTKVHEEVARGTLAELAGRFADDVKGEVVIVIEGAAAAPPASDEQVERALADELARGSSVRDAASVVATHLEVSHRRAYALALALRKGPTN